MRVGERAWLIPALKAVLPHVATIISAASPVFTKKRSEAADQTALLQQQIGELQSAVSQNAANIKELAAQLQTTVGALEQAALTAQANLKRISVLSAAAVSLSAVALCVALFLFSTR